MKHTDRSAIGLEHYFAAHSASFTGMSSFTPAEVKDLLEHTPAYARYPLASEIRSTLGSLLELDFCPRELIPDEVVRLSTELSTARCSSRSAIMTFYSWLLDIARRNEADRVARVSGLKTVASCFDSSTASFISTGLALNNQRVVVTCSGGTVTVSYAERDWGRVCVEFIGCVSDGALPSAPMPGYAFSTEAERLSDGRFEFRFLIDTLFCSTDYCERLMQPGSWHELSFTCDSVRLRLVCCDYAGRLERIGTPRAELIDQTCSALLNKQSIVGDGALSPGEVSMLPIARLITGSGGVLTCEQSKRPQHEQLILDSLDNRYAMQQFGGMLDSGRCELLSDCLGQAKDARFEDNDRSALRAARRFAVQYEQQLADGSARALLMQLADRFCEMTGGFDGSTAKMEAENAVSGKVKEAVESQLAGMRFEGSFPHYRRVKRRRTEYLSFMLLPAAELTKHGVFSCYVSLAAARVSNSRLEKLREAGIERERTTALDCQPELPPACLYGELASADDGEYVRVDTELFRFGTERRLKDDSGRLSRYIKIANRQFRFGRLPAGYSLSRIRKNTMPSPAPKIFLSALPLSVVLSLLVLIGWLFFSPRVELPFSLTDTQAIGCTAGLCVILNSIITVLRRISIAGKLWRYR